jgi:hypothetical protein
VIKGGIDRIPHDLLIGSQAAAGDSAALPQQGALAAGEIPFAFDEDGSFDSLQAENAALKAALEQLQQQYQALSTDKLKLEKNFRLLMAQTEKLKEMLRKPQAGGPEQ